jgi:predicted nucleic acid-binding protein
MKALDTPALIAVLEGEAAAKILLHRLRGVEVATTEVNLLELACIASRAPKRRRAARLAALDKLRRKLTVVPIDPAAVRESVKGMAASASPAPLLLVWAMLGALEGAGCDELFTSNPAQIPGKWRFKVTKFHKGGRNV